MKNVAQQHGDERLNQFFATLSGELNAKYLEDPSRVFARDRQVQRMRKRARFKSSDLRSKAIASFLEDNAFARDHLLSVDDDIVGNARHFLTVMLERYNSKLDSTNVQVTLDQNILFDLWRFGPGASNGVRGTHACQKILQDMTSTLNALPLVQRLRRLNPYMAKEDLRRRRWGIRRVEGSKLTTVPKNEDTERTIAIEPSGNMALQLAAGYYLMGVCRSIGLDITRQQPINKLMAKRGSIDGSFATIDLKSASNLVTPRLVQAVWPKEWYDLLMTLRSGVTVLPDGRSVELHMISTMGNGYTFPLMTLTIVALIYGYRCRAPKSPNLWVDWRKTAVFGDDIIVPTDEYEICTATLQAAGFLVNHEKSYREGPFRESCGGDYFEGIDVTPFYVKSLTWNSDVYVALNQVFEWCARENFLLPQTIQLLTSFVEGPVFLVPEWHSDDSGLRVASGFKRRYSYLRPVQQQQPYELGAYACMMVVGGYVSRTELHGNGSVSCHILPRPYKTRYRVKQARLPKGYLSGWAPEYRTRQVSTYIEEFVHVLISAQDS